MNRGRLTATRASLARSWRVIRPGALGAAPLLLLTAAVGGSLALLWPPAPLLFTAGAVTAEWRRKRAEP